MSSICIFLSWRNNQKRWHAIDSLSKQFNFLFFFFFFERHHIFLFYKNFVKLSVFSSTSNRMQCFIIAWEYSLILYDTSSVYYLHTHPSIRFLSIEVQLWCEERELGQTLGYGDLDLISNDIFSSQAHYRVGWIWCMFTVIGLSLRTGWYKKEQFYSSCSRA